MDFNHWYVFLTLPITPFKIYPKSPDVYTLIYLTIYTRKLPEFFTKFSIFRQTKIPAALLLQGYIYSLFYLFSIEAFIKSLNRGWLLVGLDLNSGWNWTATNHGWSFISTISTSLPSGDSPVISIPFCSMISL